MLSERGNISPGRWGHSARQGTDQTDSRAQTRGPCAGRQPWLLRKSAAGAAHARHSSRAALFQRYLQIHSPPSTRRQERVRAARGAPAHFPRWVGPAAGCLPPPPSPSAAIGHLRGALPPTAKADWCVGKEAGDEEPIMRERSPSHPPLWKSHVALHSAPVTTPLGKLS